MSDSCKLPEFSLAQAAEIARSLFSIEASVSALDGERDLNFLLDGAGGRFVLKIANADEAPAMLECQHAVFRRLLDARVFAQDLSARPSIHGREIEIVNAANGDSHACRVLPYIEGRVLAQVANLSADLSADLGRQLARLDLALDGFTHPALERPLLWKMDHALATVEGFIDLVTDPARRQLVARAIADYRDHFQPRAARLRRAVIHNDANRNNVLLDAAADHIVGIIDFGDMVESWLVVEAAVASTYVMLEQREPLALAQALIGGYHAELPLHEEEIEVLPELIGMRLGMSVCICAHQLTLEPDNDYLRVDVEPAWALFETLQRLGRKRVRAAMFEACGT